MKCYSFEKFQLLTDYTFYKVSTSNIILRKEMPIVNLKRERQTQDRGLDTHLYGGPEGSHMQIKNVAANLKFYLQIKNVAAN